MNEKKDLKTFLIKKFLMVIIEIAFLELFCNAFYSYVVFPYLREKIGGPFFENLGFSGYGSIALCITFLGLLFQGLISILPQMISDSLADLINSLVSGLLPKEIEGLFRLQDRDVMGMYYIGCFIIVVILLIFIILPYILGAVQFSVIIRREIKVLMDEQKEQHRKYERKRSLMLSDIAHDLKTPITTVSGYAQALRDGVVEGEDRQKQYLDAICNKSKRIDDLITLLFEYVKLDSEGFVLHMEKTDVAEILRENIALYYSDFERKKIEIVIDLPENPVFWELDRIQFSRAVANLLTNDLRHVSSGCQVIIRMKWDEAYEKMEIMLADTGEQIDSQVACHIFEPFVMGDTSRSTRGGSGLGLSISSKIVKMHGGMLYLDRNSTEEYTKAFVMVFQK